MSAKRFRQLSNKRKQKILKQKRFSGMSRGAARKAWNQKQRNKNRNKLTTNDSKKNNNNSKLTVDNSKNTQPGNTPTKPDTVDLLSKLISEFQPSNLRSEPKEIDYERNAEDIPQIDYESLQPEAPSFAKNVATAISGSSAGGIRRRRSKRSQLGMNALGTGQLKRRPKNKLTLGGLSI